MQKYRLKVSDVKEGGEDVLVIILTRALDDDEALRTAHAVADMAQQGGAENVRVAVTASDGREAGFVGGDGGDASWLERQQVKAQTHRPPTEPN